MTTMAATLQSKGLVLVSQGLALLPERLNLAHSIFLGFLSCSLFPYIFTFDYLLVKSLAQQNVSPIIISTKLAYLWVVYIGRAYFILSVIIGQLPHLVNCVAATYIRKVAFYLVLIANHWLFASRAQATWRGSKGYSYVKAYVITGILCLLTMAIVIILMTKPGIGVVVEPYGCVYIVDDGKRTLSHLSLATIIIGTVFHTANMILAAMRLSTFSEACGENTESHFSLKAFASKIREISLVPQQQQNRPMTLSQALISQGFHQWVLHLASLHILITIPEYAIQKNPDFIMNGCIIFTAIDIELGSRFYRITNSAGRRDRSGIPEQTNNTLASSQLTSHCNLEREEIV